MVLILHLPLTIASTLLLRRRVPPLYSASCAAGSSISPAVARISWVVSAPLSGGRIEDPWWMEYVSIAICFCSLSCFVPLLSYNAHMCIGGACCICYSSHAASALLMVFCPCAWRVLWPACNKLTLIRSVNYLTSTYLHSFPIYSSQFVFFGVVDSDACSHAFVRSCIESRFHTWHLRFRPDSYLDSILGRRWRREDMTKEVHPVTK